MRTDAQQVGQRRRLRILRAWRGELPGRQTPPWADGRPAPLDALPVTTLTPLTPLTYAAVLLLLLPHPRPVTPGRHHRR